MPTSQRQPEKAPVEPRSLLFATNGIRTDHDFANLMGALMSDLIDGRISPSVGNATCNAGGKLLKVVEMRYRYGVAGPGNIKTLALTFDALPPAPDVAAS